VVRLSQTLDFNAPIVAAEEKRSGSRGTGNEGQKGAA
jgi:hypothetical protein